MTNPTSGSNQNEGKCSLFMGFVYVSNLIVGTGALTMPLGVAKAGLWLAVPMLFILCLFSFMTATSVIEVMASSNAIKELVIYLNYF